MPNLYARLTDLKRDYQGASADDSDDAMLLAVSERVARAFDDQLERKFYAERTVGYYDGHGGDELRLPDDFVSVEEVALDTDGDGTFETVVVEDDDFWLWPWNRTDEPATRLVVTPFGSLGSWPNGRHAVRVTGLRGYSYELEAASTLTAAIASTSVTSVAVASVAKLSAGDTLVVDDEQMHIEAIATLTLTVVRGINGTTPATHSDAAAVSRRRYPRAIEQAAIMQTVRFARDVKTGYAGSVGNAELAGYAFRSLYPAIRDAIAPFARSGGVHIGSRRR